VAGAFAQPNQVGNGAYLPLVGDFMSFNDIVGTLNRLGHEYSFRRIPREVFATFFPLAGETAAMFEYFQAHTYLGSDMSDAIILASEVAGRKPTGFADWAQANFALTAA
jgi:hypothetical protein